MGFNIPISKVISNMFDKNLDMSYHLKVGKNEKIFMRKSLMKTLFFFLQTQIYHELKNRS